MDIWRLPRGSNTPVSYTHLDVYKRQVRECIRRQETKRIGLKNIARRIQLYYGDSYGMEIQSVPGEYTRVILTLPMEESEEKICLR